MNAVPVWVYFLLAGLLYIGIKRCFTSVIKTKRFLIMPVVLLYFSLHDLYSPMLAVPVSIFIWTAGFLMMGALGAYYVRHRNIQADKKNGLIQIPGDWTMLALIVLIFGIEFLMNYAVDSGAAYADKVWFICVMAISSGLAMGFTTGRNVMYLWKYIKAPNVCLT